MSGSMVWSHPDDVTPSQVGQGITLHQLWDHEDGAKALVVDIAPGASWPELDVHAPGPEEVYVARGTFNDGVRDYPEGSFIHCPAGSSHWPQSVTGCRLFVFYPQG